CPTPCAPGRQTTTARGDSPSWREDHRVYRAQTHDQQDQPRTDGDRVERAAAQGQPLQGDHAQADGGVNGDGDDEQCVYRAPQYAAAGAREDLRGVESAGDGVDHDAEVDEHQ